MVSLICFYNEPDGFGKPFEGPWVADASVQEVVDCYPNWEADLVNLVKARLVAFFTSKVAHSRSR